ncbi:NAD-dependent epimerase/dehydratase family protein [Kineobactrum salinum]|uniref:NAD-dependent epimerase/dehydratase family protein n=1 Tax=Kineobactrum salinum TaxID=2708301 RepID=A0A6C0TX35_9GAMM|nr:NAD-dependent epimerase/dehydratase family protein [Kineobactrum salinum]QIB64351.1 NAD-dependent epimerase/dehydratase family protein [Kineobactrum salinum]
MVDTSEVNDKPFVLITGAAGNIGSALSRALRRDYRIIALDIKHAAEADFSYEFDLTDADSVSQVMRNIAEEHGRKLAAVVHLAAYFDFSGEHSPLYDKVNIEGTRNLLEALTDFAVERFIYSSTMLVHRPGKPGTKITEQTPLAPGWIYPQSKADTEAVIRERATMPYTLLRLAGLYDDKTCVPTLAHQIARVHAANMKSHLYAGDTRTGQACLHQADMIEAFRLTIERRRQLPAENEILVGEPHSDSYEAVQQRLGELIHGEDHWATLSLPRPVAKTGAWVEEKAEPVVPDYFDKGEKPFIRPFMIDLASDHYELDISRAREQLGWEPRHRLMDGLEALVGSLQADPRGWYEANGITPPDWLIEADTLGRNPERLLQQYQQQFRRQHARGLWSHFVNMMLGLWLLSSPPLLGYTGTALAWSDTAAGAVLTGFAALSLSWRQAWARWVCAAIGLWLMFAPLLFATASAAGYLNGTLVGMLVIGLAAAVGPAPGISPVAATMGPETPPGWDHNPSSWLQRMPVIALALVGFFVARYLAAWQLGHIDGVWDPFFSGAGAGAPQLNGTEAVIGSELSESFPVSDAGMGAMVYALEVLIGLIGGTRRWRTMPWLVASFGLLIVPLGVVSITFIIIQPLIIGTWCSLCLLMAALMLLQIAYAFNEFVATGQFLRRRQRAGAPVLKIFFTGDTDEGEAGPGDDFERRPLLIARDTLVTGVNLPWNLGLCLLIGLWLMFTRVTLGSDGAMAAWDHLVGALVITVGVIAMAESARPVRWLLLPLAVVLVITPFAHDAGAVATGASLLSAVALAGLAVPRGRVRDRYGGWERWLV